MLRVLFIILFCLLANNAFAGYTYSRAITVQSSQISGGANLTQFPILVCGNGASPCNASIAGLNQSGAGSHVTNANGYDIIFTSDSGCTTKLTWEMEDYVASTGEFEAWVTNTSTPLSNSENTTFYMCYGNGAISTFQSTASSVWDSHYVGVYHFPNGTSLGLNDSTTHAANGTNSAATASAGQVDGGTNFVAASNANVDIGKTSNIAGPITVESLVNFTTNTSSQTIVANDDTSNGYTLFGYYIAGHLRTYAAFQGGNYFFGKGSLFSNLNGSVDEVRISNIVRSSGWLTTDYNNQSAPSSFYTMGAESGGVVNHQNTMQGNSIIRGVSTFN